MPIELYVANHREAIAARLNPLSRRPACAGIAEGCAGRAWWRMRDGRCVCSTCLTAIEVGMGAVFQSRAAKAWAVAS